MACGCSPELDEVDVESTRDRRARLVAPASLHATCSTRSGAPGFSMRPAMMMCVFPTASIRTVHALKSIVTVWICAAFGPGLIVPVTFLPSHSSATVTWRTSVAVGFQSPVQVPARGCPSCAKTGGAHRHAAITHDVRSHRGTEDTGVILCCPARRGRGQEARCKRCRCGAFERPCRCV